MDARLIERFNVVVGKTDTTYHLGDFSLNSKRVPEIIAKLNGKHHLVPGNHDDAWKHKHLARYAGFTVEPRSILIDGIYATHMPPADGEDPRYPGARPDATEHSVILHGHVHDRWRTRWFGDCLCLNVGVDVWNWYPVSLETIKMEIAKSPNPGREGASK